MRKEKKPRQAGNEQNGTPKVNSDNPKGLSRREFLKLSALAGGAAAVGAGLAGCAARTAGPVADAPLSTSALPGHENGVDYWKFHGREAFAYTKKDGALAREGVKGKRWVMLIDLRKCVGCQACTAACKFENNIPEGSFRTWVPDVELGTYPNTRRAFLPRQCNQCERPSCIEVCPAGATWQRKDGIVVIDYDKCWGCGACVDACPYDARFINPVTKTADKCNFCAQRVDQGLLPACVESCVGGARQFGDLKDPNDPVTRQIMTVPVQVLKPDTGNQPRVFYIDLPNQLQNNLPGRATLWSQMFEDAGFENPVRETEGQWRITDKGKKEANHA
jgi:tetrathionate reductase subunit B